MLCRSGVQQLSRWILGLWSMPSRFPWKWYQLSWHEWGANFALLRWCGFLLHVISVYLSLVSSVTWCLMFATKSVEGSAASTPIQVSTVYLVPSATRATSLSAWVWRLPSKTNRWTKHRKMTDWMHLTPPCWRKRYILSGDSYDWLVFISHQSRAVSKLHMVIPIFCCLRSNYI